MEQDVTGPDFFDRQRQDTRSRLLRRSCRWSGEAYFELAPASSSCEPNGDVKALQPTRLRLLGRRRPRASELFFVPSMGHAICSSPQPRCRE
jgi:hypothetical protein